MSEPTIEPVRTTGLPDDFVIDLTDANVARLSDERTIIDLRDHVVAEGRGGIVEAEPDGRRVSGRPLDLAEGLELVILQEEDERWEKAERFVYDTYCEMGYCSVSERNRVEELQDWNDRSEFHVVFDEHETVVGTSRIISDDYERLPIGNFTRTDFADPNPVKELSSVVVAPNLRGFSVVAYLCRSAFVRSMTDDANALVFLLEDGLIDLLANSYALPVRYFGDKRYYMGGDVSPSGMTLRGADFVDTARRNPHYWKWMLEAFTADEVNRYDLPIVLVDDPKPAEDRSEASRPVS